MRSGILALFCLLLLFLGSASAVYELCDSVERGWDGNFTKLTCNITGTKYYFTQKDIDAFWANLQNDGDYTLGRLGVVEWKLKNAVVQVADDLRFLQPEGMDLNWDISLSGDFNTSHDINQSVATAGRPANLTAIKKRIDATQNYLISFAPLENRKSIRNLSLEKEAGAVAVYILGSSINGIEIDIEGDVLLSGGYLEKVNFIKAGNIWLKEGSYISDAGFIEAKNISMEGASFLRNIGSFGATAIKLQESDSGLILKGNSHIDNISGGIEADSGIYLEDESRIETFSFAPSQTIQWITAKSLTLKGGSSIKGFGGKPGRISLSEGLVLENGKIIGKTNNRPSFISAKSISMDDNSVIQNFSEDIDVTGKELFSLSSGARIENLSGIINSCAPLSLDGNATEIEFSADSPKTIKANGIDLNNNAKIACIGEADCNYTFVRQSCEAVPTATLELDGPSSGNAPFGAKFSGICEAQGTPVTCTIDFGDGSDQKTFDGNATHVYAKAGTFKAVLVATTVEGKIAESEKKITVKQPEAPVGPAAQASLSAQSVRQGGGITIAVQCDSAIEFISIESDLGLLPVENLPLPCPATFGPFSIPENASAGTHTIVVNTMITGGQASTQELSLVVEQKQLILGLPFGLDAWLNFEPSGFMLYAITGVVIVAIALVVLLVVMRKRKAPGLPKKIEEKARSETGKKEAAERVAKEPGKPQPIAHEWGERPPWMVETEENGNDEAQTPFVREQPAEAKPVVQAAAEKPVIQTAAKPEEKPVIQTVAKPEEKPKQAPPWQGFMKRQAAPEKDSIQQEIKKPIIQAAAEKPIIQTTAKPEEKPKQAARWPSFMKKKTSPEKEPVQQAIEKLMMQAATEKPIMQAMAKQEEKPKQTPQWPGFMGRQTVPEKEPTQQRTEKPAMQAMAKPEEKPKQAPPWQGFMKRQAAPEKDSIQQEIKKPIIQAAAKPEEKPKQALPWQGFMRRRAVPEKDSMQQGIEKPLIQVAAKPEEKPKQAAAKAEGQGQDLEGLAEMVKGKGLGNSWWPKAVAKEKPETAVEKGGQALGEKPAGKASVQERFFEMKEVAKGQGEEKQGLFGGFIKRKKKPEEETEAGEKSGGNELPSWLRKGE